MLAFVIGKDDLVYVTEMGNVRSYTQAEFCKKFGYDQLPEKIMFALDLHSKHNIKKTTITL